MNDYRGWRVVVQVLRGSSVWTQFYNMTYLIKKKRRNNIITY